jgi:hypothetical protein
MRLGYNMDDTAIFGRSLQRPLEFGCFPKKEKESNDRNDFNHFESSQLI